MIKFDANLSIAMHNERYKVTSFFKTPHVSIEPHLLDPEVKSWGASEVDNFCHRKGVDLVATSQTGNVQMATSDWLAALQGGRLTTNKTPARSWLDLNSTRAAWILSLGPATHRNQLEMHIRELSHLRL